MKARKGLTLHNPYIAATERQAADEISAHGCICCGKPGLYVAGDKGKERRTGSVIYYLVGMRCVCGFINFVYLVCNDLKSYQKRNCMPAGEALQDARDKNLLVDPGLTEMLTETNVLLFQEKASDALRKSAACVARYPRDASATYNHGCLLMLHKRYHEAIGQLRWAITLDATFASSWYQLAQAYQALDDYENSIQCFDAFLRHAPEHKEAKQARARCLQRQKESKQPKI